MRKNILILITLGILVLAGIYYFNRLLNERQAHLAEEEPVVIGLSMGSVREERWMRDRDLFIKRAQELGADVIVATSDYDIKKEIFQIENLISQGVNVLVIITSDSEKIAPAIEKANQAGIKVIAYDRLIKNSNVDLYISYDNVKVGELEAESVLSIIHHGKFAYIGGSPSDNNSFLLKEGAMKALAPYITSDDIDLVINKFTDDWRPENAYKNMKDYLNAGGQIDAVVAANDGTASGVIQALKEKGLAGRVPVSGQDAELSAVKRLIEGTQTATIYKPISPLANKAAEFAISMANGLSPESTTTVDNGLIMVPAYYFEPVVVTKDNIMTTVIQDGFYTFDEIYKTTVR